MRGAWPVIVVVAILSLIPAANASAADVDPASVPGTWTGTWEVSGAYAARGAAEFTFRSVEAGAAKGTYRLTPSGMGGARGAPPFVGGEVEFNGRLSGDTISIAGNPSVRQPPGTLTVAGTKMTGRLGAATIDLAKTK
jgi:hypothetical protein